MSGPGEATEVAPLLGGRYLLRFWRRDGSEARVVCSSEEHTAAVLYQRDRVEHLAGVAVLGADMAGHNPRDCYYCRPDVYPHPGGEQ